MNSTLFDTLVTPEQRERRQFSKEKMDNRGLIVRYRVDDQTIFDLMFIVQLIDRPQHEAGHNFLSAVENSGAYPGTSSLEAGFGAPVYRIGDIISERRLAFGTAYRFAVSRCGDECARALMNIMENIFRPAEGGSVTKDQLERIAKRVSPALSALSTFYGTEKCIDPRDAVRRKVVKKKRG